MTSFPSGDRVIRGNVHWCEVPDCGHELEEMKRIDRFAWNDMNGLIADAESSSGVDLDDTVVRSPLPFSPPGAFEPPWMGELKVPGKRQKRSQKLWRLYFGEPINYQDHVVRVQLWHKESAWGHAARVRERDAIKSAMERLKWFFNKEGYDWSQLGS